MFCTVVVVCPAGSKVSGSMPTAIEKTRAPPSPSPAGASGSSTLQAPISRASAAAAARGLVLEARRRAVGGGGGGARQAGGRRGGGEGPAPGGAAARCGGGVHGLPLWRSDTVDGRTRDGGCGT